MLLQCFVDRNRGERSSKSPRTGAVQSFRLLMLRAVAERIKGGYTPLFTSPSPTSSPTFSRPRELKRSINSFLLESDILLPTMKIQVTAFVGAICAMIALAPAASAKVLWEDYCAPNAPLAGTPHVCFASRTPFIRELNFSSKFKGQFSRNQKGMIS